MRKPLKVQQVVHFFPQHPALPVQLLSPFVLSLTQLCPYPPAPEDAQPQIFQHCLLRTNTRNQSSQISKSAVGHSAMTSMGLGSGPSKVPLSLLFIPPIYHLPFQVWPLHAQILLKSSFHPFLLFTFAQNHCPEPPLYFSLVSSFPSLYRKLQCKGSALPRLISQRPVQKAHSSLPFPLITRTQIHCGFAGTRELRVLVNIPCCLLEFGCMSPALSKGEM